MKRPLSDGQLPSAALPCFKAGMDMSSIRHILNALQDIQAVVAEKIKAIRKEKGITQDRLAELTGLNRVHLYRLENGKQSMTLRTLKLIADTLNVKVRDLIGNL